MWITRALIVLLLNVHLCHSANVLAFVPGFVKSQIIFYDRLCTSIVSQGHNATIWKVYLPQNDIPVSVDEIKVRLDRDYNPPPFSLQADPKWIIQIALDFTVVMGPTLARLTELEKEKLLEVRELLENKQIDVILAHGISTIANVLHHEFNITRISLVMAGTYIADFLGHRMGIPYNPSYVPNLWTSYTDRMTYWERMHNFFIVAALFAEEEIFELWRGSQTTALREPPDGDSPSALEFLYDHDFMFINGEQLINFPRPLPWGFQYLSELGKNGGQKSQLDGQWQRIVDGAKKGVIVFSFGTVANTSELSRENALKLLYGLTAFTDYSIIWRFEQRLPEADEFPHIHVVTWLPQRDLLKHEKTVLFITHAGYNSLLESTKAGVPMVLIPLFLDQQGNAARADRLGVGVVLDKAHLTSTSLQAAISTVLSGKRYGEKARRLATMLDDKIVSPEVSLSQRIRTMSKRGHWLPTLGRAKPFTVIGYHCIDLILVYLLAVSAFAALLA